MFLIKSKKSKIQNQKVENFSLALNLRKFNGHLSSQKYVEAITFYTHSSVCIFYGGAKCAFFKNLFGIFYKLRFTLFHKKFLPSSFSNM